MSWRTTLVAPQRRQSALLEPPLMTSHGAHRTIEHPGRSDLIGPALFHQAHHRQRFGHAIGHCILGQDHARNDHHSVAVLRSDQAAFIDDARAVGVAGLRKQVRGWESRHIRRRYGAGQKSGQVWVRTLLQPGLPESPEKSGNPKRYVRSSGIKGKSFSVAELAAAGVKRVSFAASLYRTALTGLLNAAREIKTAGTFNFLDQTITSADLNPFLGD